MLSIPQVREITQLWLDPNPQIDLADALERLNAGNHARDDMLKGILSVDDYLDVLADLRLDMDQFCNSVERGLAEYGNNPGN